MKKVIWKFEIKTTDGQQIDMPIGAEILTVQIQRGKPCIWAICNPLSENEKRTFEIYGTGNPYPSKGQRSYIGTYQEAGGGLVWHLFELIKL